MASQMPNKKEKRLEFFQKSFQSFIDKESDKILSGFKKIELNSYSVDLEVRFFDEVSNDINNQYWHIIDNHVRPILFLNSNTSNTIENKNDSKTKDDSYVDIYKILSTIEYSISGLKPLYLVYKKNNDNFSEIDYQSNDVLQRKLVAIENIVNSYLGFSTALNFIKNWDGYKDLFQENKLIRSILDYNGELPKERPDDDSLSICVEHIYIMAFTQTSPSMPVFLNSTWWRLFCFTAFALNKNGIQEI